jgi:hypothetical protein
MQALSGGPCSSPPHNRTKEPKAPLPQAQIPYSGFGVMSRFCASIAVGRLIRVACFLSTVLPNPRPGCYARRFPPPPDSAWEALRIGFTTLRGMGGCNDLIFRWGRRGLVAWLRAQPAATRAAGQEAPAECGRAGDTPKRFGETRGLASP